MSTYSTNSQLTSFSCELSNVPADTTVSTTSRNLFGHKGRVISWRQLCIWWNIYRWRLHNCKRCSHLPMWTLIGIRFIQRFKVQAAIIWIILLKLTFCHLKVQIKSFLIKMIKVQFQAMEQTLCTMDLQLQYRNRLIHCIYLQLDLFSKVGDMLVLTTSYPLA